MQYHAKSVKKRYNASFPSPKAVRLSKRIQLMDDRFVCSAYTRIVHKYTITSVAIVLEGRN